MDRIESYVVGSGEDEEPDYGWYDADGWHDDYYDEYDDDYDDDGGGGGEEELSEEYYERKELREDNLEFYDFKIPDAILDRLPFLKELPEGIGVMGGVARSVAREMITGEREPIRDIDLVNILDDVGHSLVSDEDLDMLAGKYMEDDYAYGHGIQSTTLDDYFGSRDFTINQVLLTNGRLIVSDAAYNDFEENIIRPTYFEMKYSNTQLSGRIFMKALMMRGVLSLMSESVPLLEDVNPPERIRPFDKAVFLNKMMSRGVKAAHVFTEDLVDWGVVPEKYFDRPMTLAKDLLGEVYNFAFRLSSNKRFVDVEGCEDMNGFFEAVRVMEDYYATDPGIKNAIRDYTDGGSVEYDTIGGYERLMGKYTEADYNYINNDKTPR